VKGVRKRRFGICQRIYRGVEEGIGKERVDGACGKVMRQSIGVGVVLIVCPADSSDFQTLRRAHHASLAEEHEVGRHFTSAAQNFLFDG
jgi:hypothetical protein